MTTMLSQLLSLKKKIRQDSKENDNMFDLEAYGVVGFILLIISIIVIRIGVVIVVAGATASYLGLTGILWWCSAIVIFLLINGLISALSK